MGVTVATIILAVATFGVVLVTYGQLRLARAAAQIATRPLLVDPTPQIAPVPQETILFGAPGRISPTVGLGELFYAQGPGTFHLSVAFENAGAGVAAIVGADTEPHFDCDTYVSRRFVPPGSTVRVNIAILTTIAGNEQFDDHWWAMDPLALVIKYTDANGGQPMTSKALFTQAATRAPYVSKVEVYRGRKQELLTTGIGSY